MRKIAVGVALVAFLSLGTEAATAKKPADAGGGKGGGGAAEPALLPAEVCAVAELPAPLCTVKGGKGDKGGGKGGGGKGGGADDPTGGLIPLP